MKSRNSNTAVKIGIFDSGIGGLSVVRATHELLPGLDIIYVADQAHVPYGRRQMTEIRSFSEQITRFLLAQGVDLVVVACNTASAAALKYLRQTFPSLPIVGMEPAVKPASQQSLTRAVGILATPATFQGELYQSLVHKYGEGLQIYQDTCAGLVEEIEAGHLKGSNTRHILEMALEPMLANKVDTIVLGCTHYPFVLSLLREIAGDKIQVIDPAPAVARRVGTLLKSEFDYQDHPDKKASFNFFTSAAPILFQYQIDTLLGYQGEIQKLIWKNEDGLEIETKE
ncbi:MAG: glutamate racemase [Chloroflexi bacterium]|nr:glutamate racemase [Chloroflexota bacterium]